MQTIFPNEDHENSNKAFTRQNHLPISVIQRLRYMKYYHAIKIIYARSNNINSNKPIFTSLEDLYRPAATEKKHSRKKKQYIFVEEAFGPQLAMLLTVSFYASSFLV